jgi:hypothetical protein
VPIVEHEGLELRTPQVRALEAMRAAV